MILTASRPEAGAFVLRCELSEGLACANYASACHFFPSELINKTDVLIMKIMLKHRDSLGKEKKKLNLFY